MSRWLVPLTWLAFPVYVWQGVGVRMRTQRMVPAQGPVLHAIAGKQPAIALLVLGDSSAASVGIGKTEDGLAAQLAQLVSERTGRAVRWRAAGFSSATANQLRDYVIPNLSAEPWTHIVLSIGTNDTKNFHSVPRFKKDFGGMLYALRAKFPEARVVWSPVVDLTRVPALPSMLGKILEIRAGAMNRMGERLCNERGAV
ncbi:SGNH/GDSL hydrolase family protein, partial [Salmonella enterica subsp. enterica serovar Newport]|nr:SGNH/GDSL hydrolase family protein [Salmonella enterica subsp. enterica serovar Newport]